MAARPALSRRALLAGAGALALAGCGDHDAGSGRVVSGSFVSQARGRRVGWSIAYPPGSRAGLPVVVVLHGKGGDHTVAFGQHRLGLDRALARVVHAGGTPYALASVDGGNTYWHHRRDGEDAAAMVVEELLPLLHRRRLDVSRIGLLGWSMGGYGGLRLAGVLGPERVAGVTAMSPALWHRYADAAPGAFDDAADFARNAVLGRQRRLDGIRVRIDCGESDPFAAATRDYRAGFAHPPAGGLEPGGHTPAYWRRTAPVQLRFLAAALG